MPFPSEPLPRHRAHSCSRRPGLSAAFAVFVVVALAGCTPPGGGDTPPTTSGLPSAPRFEFPDALPEGSLALVQHISAEGEDSFHVVDAEGSRPVDDDADRLLVLDALGWRSVLGAELRPTVDGLDRCTSADPSTCEPVPGIDHLANIGFSPDGSKFAVLDDQVPAPVMRVVDTVTLELVVEATTTHHSTRHPPVWSPDSSHLLLPVPVDLSESSDVGALATLEARDGAEPQVVVDGTADTYVATPIGWGSDDRLTYMELSFTSLDAQYTIRSTLRTGGGDRTLGPTSQMAFTILLSDGSVISAPPMTEDGAGQVPHLYAPTGGAPVPLALPQELTTVDGVRRSFSAIAGVVLPR